MNKNSILLVFKVFHNEFKLNKLTLNCWGIHTSLIFFKYGLNFSKPKYNNNTDRTYSETFKYVNFRDLFEMFLWYQISYEKNVTKYFKVNEYYLEMHCLEGLINVS